MVSCIVSCIAICALASVGYSFPVIEEHQEIGIPETVVGHEELLGHQVGLSQELHEHELEPKHATSYQSFHIESKHHAVPIVIKTVHPPTFKHFSGAGESFGHEISEKIVHPPTFKHFSGAGESFGHEISEPILESKLAEPIDLKLHGI